MANFCLVKEKADQFKKALRDREIDPIRLAKMTSAERHKFLGKYVGEENAKQVNSLFESKLLLKNQKAGYITWAKKVAGISTEAKRDLISRIERMDRILNPQEEKMFFKDLAGTKLNTNITAEEAKNIFDMTQKMKEAKTKITEDMPSRTSERLEYGLQKELLKQYVGKLKDESSKITFKENKVKYVSKILWNTIPDLAQSIQTSYDNSIWGRQLITVLFNPRYSTTWIRNFLRSWKDIGKALKGEDPILAVKADVNSRTNALNGKYSADPQGYGLGIEGEEVYSVRFPARIPVLGRLYKASESAFNGGALRVRADLADLHIKAAETAGKNVLDKEFASGLGNFVTAITGRAAIKGEGWARSIFYAPRMYLADIHQLTSHLLDPRASSYVKREAAKNLALLLGTYSLLFTTAKMIDPESVDTQKHLGQIKIWGTWIDFTGGRASFVSLASKMSQKMYGYSQGKQPKYGEASALDDLLNFAENKFSPKASVLKDILKGEMYGGKKVTLMGELRSKFTPISSQNIEQLLNDPKAENILGSAILDGLGFSVRSQTQLKKDWSNSPTKAQQAFLDKVGEDKFKQANDEYNKTYNNWYDKASQKDEFKNLSDTGKQSLTTNAKEDIQTKIFKKYGFKYKEKQTKEKKDESKVIKKLLN